MKIYQIYPSIGIARFGDSDEYYLGPQVLDINFLSPDRNYRDANGDIKRLGQQYRIFEIENGQPL